MEEVNRFTQIVSEHEERIARTTLLYQYKTDRYQDATDTLKSLEGNALKLFSSLSILVTAFILIIRYNTDVLLHTGHSLTQATALTAAGVTFITLCSSWRYVFGAVVSGGRAKFPLADVDNYFEKGDRCSTLFSMVDWYSLSLSNVQNQYNLKSLLIEKAFNDMKFTGCGFIIFVISVFLLNIN